MDSLKQQVKTTGPDEQAFIRRVFLEGRSFRKWQDRDVDPSILEAAYDLAKLGPTSANSSPLRLVFLTSPEAKERLRPHLDKGNVTQTMEAPVTVIFAEDPAFYEHLPRLYPYSDARAWFAGPDKEALATKTAFHSATLQAAYFMLAARTLGLDCGPMSGFNRQGVEEEFFATTGFRANFLCNLGYGLLGSPKPRAPRFDFSEVAQIL